MKPSVIVKLEKYECIKRTPKTKHEFKGIPSKYKYKTIDNGVINYVENAMML